MKVFKDKLRILVAAGGTGGHLLPALEVVRKLEILNEIPSGRLRIEFVGVGRPIEAKVLESEGFVRHRIASLGIKGKGLAGIWSFLKILPATYRTTKALIDSFRPDIVVGFGGYPSVFPIIVARVFGVPTWIHEADSSAGWATKFLSIFATQVSSGFENIKLPFCRRALFSGHPIRAGISPAEMREESFAPKKILVLGGSQGAKSLDLAMKTAVSSLNRTDLFIKHQARADRVLEVLGDYQKLGINAEVLSFISDMPGALNEADLIISRAGAGAVMELSVLNKPVVFVPLPNVSGHQLQNAKSMEKHGKALIVEEGANFELRLEDAIGHLLDPKVYRAMMQKPFVNRKTSAAMTIAQGVVDLGLKGKYLVRQN